MVIGVTSQNCFSAIEHLVCYLEKVTEAAPGLPMYYYHIPCRTGVKCECYSYPCVSLVGSLPVSSTGWLGVYMLHVYCMYVTMFAWENVI